MSEPEAACPTCAERLVCDNCGFEVAARSEAAGLDAEALAQRIAAAMDDMGIEGNRENIAYAREIVDRAALA